MCGVKGLFGHSKLGLQVKTKVKQLLSSVKGCAKGPSKIRLLTVKGCANRPSKRFTWVCLFVIVLAWSQLTG